jgi:chromate transporter
MLDQLQIFWMFLKINFLSTSGPASVGLLYDQTVGRFISESEFVEAVGFASTMPGSDAMQLAMFVGHAIGGVPGAIAALMGSILPPTLLMMLVVSVLSWLRGEVWVTNFVKGLTPAVAVLMVIVGVNLFRGDNSIPMLSLVIGALSLIALLLKAPSPVVLLGAGLMGVLFTP